MNHPFESQSFSPFTDTPGMSSVKQEASPFLPSTNSKPKSIFDHLNSGSNSLPQHIQMTRSNLTTFDNTLVKTYEELELDHFEYVNDPPRMRLPCPVSELTPLQLQDMLEKQKILHLLHQNNLLLGMVVNRSSTTCDSLAKCKEYTSNFQKQVENEAENNKMVNLGSQPGNPKTRRNDNPSLKSLFNHFFGNQRAFRFELVLDCKIPNPISKGKNMIIKVKLVDPVKKQIVRNSNKIILTIGLFTWEIPSKPIVKNKIGNKALTGQPEIEMVNGEGVFNSLQINEVTSKFINKHVAMVITPSRPANQGISLDGLNNSEENVSFESIKPLIIEKVVVKSQKKKVPHKPSLDDDNDDFN